MHSYQIYNLHRIAINIVIARHISWYVSYRDLGQDTQPYHQLTVQKSEKLQLIVNLLTKCSIFQQVF